MLPRSLNREFAFTINDVARMLRTYADYRGAQFGVTRAQWAVLVRLDRFEGLKQSELAEMLDLQPITLTRLLDRLCESGLIERRSDPNDRRAKRLFLTAAARPMLEQLGALGEDMMTTALAGVSRETVEQIVAQLAVVKENLRQAIQQRPARPAAPAQRESAAMAEPVLKLAPSLKPAKPRAATLTDALRKRMRFILLVVVPVIAVVAGFLFYLLGGRYVSTDDAYVHAAKLMVSTDVSGLVSEVDVREGQAVKAGDVLFRVDPRQFQIALDNAKANLAQTALSLQAMKEDYMRMQQDIAAQQSQVELDETTFARDAALLKTNAVAQSTYDQAHFTLEGDKSKLESLRQACASPARPARRQCGFRRHAASAISAGQGAGRRGATPARSHRGARAVRRRGDPGRCVAARHLSGRPDRGADQYRRGGAGRDR